MATNVDVTNNDNIGLGGNSSGLYLKVINSEAKGAQNDTLTITDASLVIAALLYDDTTGVIDAATISTNVLTLTTAATGTVSGLVVFQK